MQVRSDVPPRPGGTGQCPVEGAWRFAVPSVEPSVPRVRRAVRDLLAGQGLSGPPYEEVVDGVLLVVSELVTNVVRHAALLSPRMTVEVVIRGGWVGVAVQDGHPYRPAALQNDCGRTGGRGLLLVRAVAAEAGGSCDVVRTPDGGKTVRACLRLPGPPAAPLRQPGRGARAAGCGDGGSGPDLLGSPPGSPAGF